MILSIFNNMTGKFDINQNIIYIKIVHFLIKMTTEMMITMKDYLDIKTLEKVSS